MVELALRKEPYIIDPNLSNAKNILFSSDNLDKGNEEEMMRQLPSLVRTGTNKLPFFFVILHASSI